jgi:hypothetical protein
MKRGITLLTAMLLCSLTALLAADRAMPAMYAIGWVNEQGT